MFRELHVGFSGKVEIVQFVENLTIRKFFMVFQLAAPTQSSNLLSSTWRYGGITLKDGPLAKVFLLLRGSGHIDNTSFDQCHFTEANF